MPGCPRGDIVPKGEIGVFHCWNHCGQSGVLCGYDKATDTDYTYRHQWIGDTERVLAAYFAVDIAFYATMSNHIHLIVRTRPDIAASWSDTEVVRRWLIIAKLKRNGTDQVVEPTEAEIAKERNRGKKRVAKLRRRLADVSWFMGTLCENISRRCNRESGRRGAFWEGRFQCRNLAGESAILVCATYVDLNPLRAGIAATPEQSRYTSAYDRIQGMQQRAGQADQGTAPANGSPKPDEWLCPLTLGQRLEPAGGQPADSVPSARASNDGILPLTLEQYLKLLDWTGRQIVEGKKGAIPESLPPILDRLDINQARWLDAVSSFDKWFGHVVGSAEKMAEAAKRAGRHWFRGQAHCADTFGDAVA